MDYDTWKATDLVGDEADGRARAVERARDLSVVFSRKSDLWTTPRDLFARVDADHAFGLDAAAVAESALCARWLGPGSPLADDALAAPSWHALAHGRPIWLNPPYSRCAAFVARAAAEVYAGATVVVLVPSRTDTRWWHQYVWSGAGPRPGVTVEFVRGRLKFGTATAGAPFPSVLITMRPA